MFVGWLCVYLAAPYDEASDEPPVVFWPRLAALVQKCSVGRFVIVGMDTNQHHLTMLTEVTAGFGVGLRTTKEVHAWIKQLLMEGEQDCRTLAMTRSHLSEIKSGNKSARLTS